MTWIKESGINLFKTSQLDQLINGPVVDDIISAVQTMFNRGAPTIYDYSGFNKIDFDNPVLLKLQHMPLGSSVSIQDLDIATKRLLVYRKQLPNAPTLRANFEKHVSSLSNSSAENNIDNHNIVKILGAGDYGKIKIFIPNAATNLPKIKLNNVLRSIAKSLNWEQKRNQFGVTDYEIYKGFSLSKSGLNTYEILPSFVPGVANFLATLGYKTNDLLTIDSTNTNQPSIKQNMKASCENEGENFVIKFDWHTELGKKFIEDFKSFVASLGVYGLQYKDFPKRWIASGLKKNKLKELEDFFKKHGYETTFPKISQEEFEKDSLVGVKLKIINVSAKGPYHMGFNMPSTNIPEIRELRNRLNELMQYSFPIDAGSAEDKIGNRYMDLSGKFTGGYPQFYCIRGEFNDYVSFAEILRKKGFDLTDYRNVLGELIKSGKVKPMKADGVLDGYIKMDENGNPMRYPLNYPDRKLAGKFIEDVDKFNEELNQYTIKKPGKPPAHLLDPQKECIKHAYSRHGVLNGSHTGSGKTIFFIAAADMRVKQDGGGRILVITENGPKMQWMREIYGIANADMNDVSETPNGFSKWTVMHYNQFGTNIDGDALKTKNNAAMKYVEKAQSILNKMISSTTEDIKLSESVRRLLNEHISNLPKISIESTGFDVEQLDSSPQINAEFENFNQYIQQFLIQLYTIKASTFLSKNGEKLFDSVESYIELQLEKINVFKKMQKAAELVKLINDQNYRILILDECHNVKNDSNQSNNIIRISEKIPIKWGGSATISANKPIDVYRQLKVIGHNLGKLSKKQFNDAFVGAGSRKITTGDGKEINVSFDATDVNSFFKHLRQRVEKSADAWADGRSGEFPLDVECVTQLPDETVLRLANKELKQYANAQVAKVMNLTEWLALTEVYMSKTKEDINPNIPEHIVSDDIIHPDYKEAMALEREVKKLTATFKDPGLAVSEMLAYRTKMAEIKVKYTLEKARPILESGKKVLIFTCFRSAGRMLHIGLDKIIKSRKTRALLAMGDDDSSDRQIKVDEFKNPESKVQALVLGILSGGTGLDIPNVVEHVIMNDFDWTPKASTQAEGRAYRVNAELPVNTYYMVLRNTPDIIYYKQVQKKKNLAKFIQQMDKEFTNRVNNNLPTDDLVAKCQEEQWEVILEQIREKIGMMRWLKAGGHAEQADQVVAKNWMHKIIKLSKYTLLNNR